MGHEPWGLLLKIVNIEWYIRTFFFNFNFKLYIIVLVLPNIKMNPPQVLHVHCINNSEKLKRK